MTPDRKEAMDRVINDLTGTCMDLNKSLWDNGLIFESLAQEDLLYLDENIMQCEECSWWCESNELNDDQICEDCRE